MEIRSSQNEAVEALLNGAPISSGTNNAVRAVDIFCGAGGLTYGLRQAGIQVVEGVDLNEDCRYAYEFNNNARFVHKNIINYMAENIDSALAGSKVKILVGCAPCQPFSAYTQGPRRKHKDKWVLLDRFGELARDSQPDIVSMENVVPLADTDRFRLFEIELTKAGYQVHHRIVDCRHYGAPQKRRRLVLLASRHGKINLIAPTHPSEADWKTVREAIGEMPYLNAGEADPTDPLHRTSRLSEVNTQRIVASKPGGTWRDWPDHLRAVCHTKRQARHIPRCMAAWNGASQLRL